MTSSELLIPSIASPKNDSKPLLNILSFSDSYLIVRLNVLKIPIAIVRVKIIAFVIINVLKIFFLIVTSCHLVSSSLDRFKIIIVIYRHIPFEKFI